MLFDGLVVSGLAAPGYDFMDRLLLFLLISSPRQFQLVQDERHSVREREGLVAAVADVLSRAACGKARSEMRKKKVRRSPVQCA